MYDKIFFPGSQVTESVSWVCGLASFSISSGEQSMYSCPSSMGRFFFSGSLTSAAIDFLQCPQATVFVAFLL